MRHRLHNCPTIFCQCSFRSALAAISDHRSVSNSTAKSLLPIRRQRGGKGPSGGRAFEEWETKSEQITPSPERWESFRRELDRLNLWCWQPEYFEPACDGARLSAEIVYSDRTLSPHGSNCFPGQNGDPISIVDRTKNDTFEQFCRAVSSIVGRPFR